MKVHFTPDRLLNNYVNVVFTQAKSNQPGDYHAVNCGLLDFKAINNVVEQSEATEIVADTVCDFLRREDLGNFIQFLISRLRKGGELVIGGTDVIAVCRGIANAQIDLLEANKLLYGNTVRKEGMSSLRELAEHLASLGLKVIDKVVDSSTNMFYVRVSR